MLRQRWSEMLKLYSGMVKLSVPQLTLRVPRLIAEQAWGVCTVSHATVRSRMILECAGTALYLMTGYLTRFVWSRKQILIIGIDMTETQLLMAVPFLLVTDFWDTFLSNLNTIRLCRVMTRWLLTMRLGRSSTILQLTSLGLMSDLCRSTIGNGFITAMTMMSGRIWNFDVNVDPEQSFVKSLPLPNLLSVNPTGSNRCVKQCEAQSANDQTSPHVIVEIKS